LPLNAIAQVNAASTAQDFFHQGVKQRQFKNETHDSSRFDRKRLIGYCPNQYNPNSAGGKRQRKRQKKPNNSLNINTQESLRVSAAKTLLTIGQLGFVPLDISG